MFKNSAFLVFDLFLTFLPRHNAVPSGLWKAMYFTILENTYKCLWDRDRPAQLAMLKFALHFHWHFYSFQIKQLQNKRNKFALCFRAKNLRVKSAVLTLFLSNLSMWVSDFSSFCSPVSPCSPYTQIKTLEFVPALETSPVNTCTRYVFSKIIKNA